MTIIEFPKPLQDNNLKQENIQRQKSYVSQAPKLDSFEFVDYELDDTPNESFMSKVGGLFRKKPNVKHLSQESAYNKSQIVQFDAMGTKIEVGKILFRAAGNDYQDVDFLDGSRIGFEEDALGRLVMIENDANGKCTRETTFIPYTDEIIKIEEAQKDSKKINRIVFFNDSHFEVTKGQSIDFWGTTKDEVFVFKENEPRAYYNNIMGSDNNTTYGDYYEF